MGVSEVLIYLMASMSLIGKLLPSTSGLVVAAALSSPASSSRHDYNDEMPPDSMLTKTQWAKLQLIAAKDPAAASMAYIEWLRHSDDSNGSHVNCTTPQLIRFGYQVLSTKSYDRFDDEVRATVRTANLLSDLFRFRSASNRAQADAFYYSLLMSLVELDSIVFGAAISFDTSGATTPSSHYVYRLNDQLLAQQISGRSTDPSAVRSRESSEWLWKQRNSKINRKQLACGNLPKTGDPYHMSPSSVVTKRQGLWSDPYYDCRIPPTWILTYSVPFYGCTNNDTIGFKGVVAIEIDLNKIDVNQCEHDGDDDDDDGDYGFFAGTHKCRATTECRHVKGNGFRRGSYECTCARGYYFPRPNDSRTFFDGAAVERRYVGTLLNSSHFSDGEFQCLPCSHGCDTCVNGTRCFAEYDVVMRGVPLGVQSFCITIAVLVGFVIVRLRKTKVIKMSMWVLLEIIIFGTLLLYATVIIQYFEPTQVTCTLVPWLRELGFAVVYGALVLKIYRILCEFQSRKAHCVHIRDRDLIKYLFAIVLVVAGYMAAWSAITIEYANEGHSLVVNGTTPAGLSYHVCRSHWWDYVIEMGEFLFLSCGVYWSYCIRTAPSDYYEAKYVSWAIYNEAIVSTIMHIIRHVVWLKIHPDYVLLMYFIRCQMTVTITLILIIGPKLWYVHRPPECSAYRTRAYSADAHETVLPESTKLRLGVSSNGDVDLGEMSLSEMDPEDIRAELRKLYTQLQIYKTKTMRKDNPHISKRRGGRKQTHRRFSLQAFHHKHKHHHEPRSDFEHELSKTPEESTNSAEGVAISMAEESSIGECRTPTVTFKPGHKSMY